MTSVELIDFLGNLPDNDVNLPVLAQQMASGTGVVPFVGAGISAPYNSRSGALSFGTWRNAPASRMKSRRI
jgi:hypothetical protein